MVPMSVKGGRNDGGGVNTNIRPNTDHVTEVGKGVEWEILRTHQVTELLVDDEAPFGVHVCMRLPHHTTVPRPHPPGAVLIINLVSLY